MHENPLSSAVPASGRCLHVSIRSAAVGSKQRKAGASLHRYEDPAKASHRRLGYKASPGFYSCNFSEILTENSRIGGPR